MDKENVVSTGYIKLLALKVDDLETEIIMEKNTNSQDEIDEFKNKYESYNNILIFVLHMDYDNHILFEDYKKEFERIHCFDYLKNLLMTKMEKFWKEILCCINKCIMKLN